VIDQLIRLVVGVIVVGLLAWLLRWSMAALGVPEPFVTVVWILFFLIVILAIVGLLGHGPLKGSWRSPP
jgi:hypothetical protein